MFVIILLLNIYFQTNKANLGLSVPTDILGEISSSSSEDDDDEAASVKPDKPLVGGHKSNTLPDDSTKGVTEKQQISEPTTDISLNTLEQSQTKDGEHTRASGGIDQEKIAKTDDSCILEMRKLDPSENVIEKVQPARSRSDHSAETLNKLPSKREQTPETGKVLENDAIDKQKCIETGQPVTMTSGVPPEVLGKLQSKDKILNETEAKEETQLAVKRKIEANNAAGNIKRPEIKKAELAGATELVKKVNFLENPKGLKPISNVTEPSQKTDSKSGGKRVRLKGLPVAKRVVRKAAPSLPDLDLLSRKYPMRDSRTNSEDEDCKTEPTKTDSVKIPTEPLPETIDHALGTNSGGRKRVARVSSVRTSQSNLANASPINSEASSTTLKSTEPTTQNTQPAALDKLQTEGGDSTVTASDAQSTLTTKSSVNYKHTKDKSDASKRYINFVAAGGDGPHLSKVENSDNSLEHGQISTTKILPEHEQASSVAQVSVAPDTSAKESFEHEKISTTKESVKHEHISSTKKSLDREQLSSEISVANEQQYTTKRSEETEQISTAKKAGDHEQISTTKKSVEHEQISAKNSSGHEKPTTETLLEHEKTATAGAKSLELKGKSSEGERVSSKIVQKKSPAVTEKGDGVSRENTQKTASQDKPHPSVTEQNVMTAKPAVEHSHRPRKGCGLSRHRAGMKAQLQRDIKELMEENKRTTVAQKQVAQGWAAALKSRSAKSDFLVRER